MIVFLNGAFGVGKTSTARMRVEVWRELSSGFREADAALRDEEYGTEIPTDERTPEEIGAVILGTL